MSLNFEQEFVNPDIWNEFKSRFRSPVTEASYKSDIAEFCRITGKQFEKADADDVEKYYIYISKKVRDGILSPLTMTKKFRELHSLSKMTDFDYFYPYLKNMCSEKSIAGFIPVEDMDRLFSAASDNLMVYTILTLMYRAGMSSTEIISLNGEADFLICEQNIYALLPERREPCFIPNDAWKILSEYMKQRDFFPSLFYNSRGRRLNVMYISRMMKKYCKTAGIRQYSAESVRNCCAFNLFSYGAEKSQVAAEMGRTQQQIHRYMGKRYKDGLKKNAGELVRIKIERPSESEK